MRMIAVLFIMVSTATPISTATTAPNSISPTTVTTAATATATATTTPISAPTATPTTTPAARSPCA